MNATELLHQYFDEGLDPALEDVLFEQLSVSHDLRREFAEHLRLQSFIGEDLRNITPPAAVTAAVFAGAGLTAPAAAHAAAGAAFSAPAKLLRAAGAAVAAHLPVIIAALLSALLTSGMFFLFAPAPVLTRDTIAATRIDPVSTLREQPGTRVATIPSAARRTRAAVTSPVASKHLSQARAARTTPNATVDPNAAAGTDAALRLPLASIPAPPAAAPGMADLFAPPPSENTAASVPQQAAPEADIPIQHVAAFPPESFDIESFSSGSSGMRFFQYHNSGTLLKNLVFEMRLLNSRSTPSVDMPHNSHDVFKDMAISAVVKVSDMHAFGLEYGRETFGQEYQSMNARQSVAAGEPVRIVYDPPAPWIPAVVQRNQMLDWYGAVWRLSFPKLGILDFVYPYTRTFIGGTKQGPLAKFRFGIEMYPSNYSMFNFGLEGTLLNYIVEGSWHKTYKLGATFGVAIGF